VVTKRRHAWQNVQYAIHVRGKENVWPTTRLFVVSVAAKLATLTNAQVVPFIKAFHITEITEKFPSTECSKCLIQWNFRTFRFDIEDENEFTDKIALQLLELAFDKYYFKDSELAINNSELKIQFERMLQIIEQDLTDISKEQLIKVMASIYRSIQRRTSGGRVPLLKDGI